MIVAQKQTGTKVITKKFSALAWSLLGNDKQGWSKVDQAVENKVMTEPPTGDAKEVRTDNKGNLEIVVDNKVAPPVMPPPADEVEEPPVTPPSRDINPNAEPGNEAPEVKLQYISKDYATAKQAKAAMDTLQTKEQVEAFIKGEDRAAVLKHAQIYLTV